MTVSGIGSSYQSLALLQLERMKQNTASMLKKFDSNEDGVLSKDEFSTLLTDLTEKTGGTSLDVEELFSTLDTNDDNTLNADEMEELSKLMPPPPPPPDGGGMFAEMLKKFDTNGDGVLSKEELSSLVNDISSKSGQTLDADKIFTALDVNGDNTIDEEEMKEFGKIVPPPEGARGPAMMGAQSISDFSLLNSIDSTSSTSNSDSTASGSIKALYNYVLEMYQTRSELLAYMNQSSQFNFVG
ncbi:MAG: EF-hand domain-containing protein [Caldisericia bacterium]|nr:EF-hand domain-containing protein [Caldisericia bacterium]